MSSNILVVIAVEDPDVVVVGNVCVNLVRWEMTTNDAESQPDAHGSQFVVTVLSEGSAKPRDLR